MTQPPRERGQAVPPDQPQQPSQRQQRQQQQPTGPRPRTMYPPASSGLMQAFEPDIGRKVDDGQSVRVMCPAGRTLEVGEFAILEGFHGFFTSGVPMDIFDDADEREVALQTDGATYETAQLEPGDAFDVRGAVVYWNEGTHLLTTQAAGRAVGRVTLPKDSEGNIWMRLLPQTGQP